MHYLKVWLFSLLAVSSMVQSEIFSKRGFLPFCGLIPPLCIYEESKPTDRRRVGIWVPRSSTVTVNGSTISWGARKALAHVNKYAEKSSTRIGIPQLFALWGMPLMEKYLNQPYMSGMYPTLRPETLKAFIATFAPGNENDVRLQKWDGQKRAPFLNRAVRMHVEGELVVQGGQIVHVRPGTRIRMETNGILETWTDGHMAQCIGGCTETSPPHWERFMRNGYMKEFIVGPAEEFVELHFKTTMRIILQTDRAYVLYLPKNNNEPLVAETRTFAPKENVNIEAWSKLPPPGRDDHGIRVCEKGREYEGEVAEVGEKHCQGPSILFFRNWDWVDGKKPGSLPPRPLTTVWDFVREMFHFQASNSKAIDTW